jgi:hypothetical protein
MTQQLSLFPESALKTLKTLQDENMADLETAFNPVDEVFAAVTRFRSSRDFMELMQFIARFPNYSAFNGLLLYLQNPAATYVATARTWAQRFKRHPRREAKPLVILAPMAPILFLFDLQDTAGAPVPSVLLRPREIAGQLLGKIYANTLHNATLHGICVYETILNAGDTHTASRITPALRKKYRDLELKKDISYLILIDKTQTLENRYASLAYELGHIFCSHLGIDRHAWWPERDGLNINGEEIEAESVAYLVCRRRSLQASTENFLINSSGTQPEMPLFSINAVIQAVGYIEDMGKHRWKGPKKGRSI